MLDWCFGLGGIWGTKHPSAVLDSPTAFFEPIEPPGFWGDIFSVKCGPPPPLVCGTSSSSLVFSFNSCWAMFFLYTSCSFYHPIFKTTPIVKVPNILTCGRHVEWRKTGCFTLLSENQTYHTSSGGFTYFFKMWSAPNSGRVVVSNIFGIFNPKSWGRWTHLDVSIFFKWVGSTTKQVGRWPNLINIVFDVFWRAWNQHLDTLVVLSPQKRAQQKNTWLSMIATSYLLRWVAL